MITKIDWLSFTVTLPKGDGRTEREMPRLVEDALEDLAAGMTSWLQLDRGVKVGKGRAPYSFSLATPDNGITVFMHPRLTHALIEISGKGCEQLRAAGYLEFVLEEARPRVTRLDIACDMEVNTTPQAFAEARDTERFRSHGHIISESGTTYYVGSRSSDRYARVYRYNPPHERAHLLRCEMVIKAELAKLAAGDILRDGLPTYAAMMGNVFKWSHPSWTPDEQTDITPKTWRPERHEGKTLYWLADTVAPLLARLHKEGVIDAIDWLRDTVLPLIELTDNQ